MNTTQKTVEEVVEHAKRSLRKAGFIAATLNKQETADTQLDFILRYILTQDRVALHTSLVAAVEWKRLELDSRLAGGSHTNIMKSEYNQAIDDTITIINSIFKE